MLFYLKYNNNNNNFIYRYNTLYNQVKLDKDLIAIAKGEILVSKSMPLKRPQMIKIIDQLLSSNDKSKIQMAAVFCFDFKCCGRSGEGVTAAVSCLQWHDTYDVLEVDWSMVKVGKQKPLLIANDFTDWQLDPYLLYAFMCLYKDTTNDVKNKLFPILNVENGRNKIGSALKSLTNFKKYDGTSIRVGAIESVLSHPAGTFQNAVFFAGHDHTNLCATFEYIYKYPIFLKEAAMIIANYPVISENFIVMSLDCVYDSFPEETKISMKTKVFN